MEAERSDAGGGGGGAEVVDEFACAGMLRGSLTSLHGTVERIFGVAFDIGEREVSPASDGQIWLKLQGQENGVRAAKLFVKGVVNQEEQQEVSYPAVLHCVFCGARGLFVDSLIRNTSAQIMVGTMGYLLISGLAEPVVRAYSLITDLVEKYECTQSRSSEPGERSSGESLDSRRAFKTLVEKWDDRHILDLLVLPGAVKEVLLDLVRESGLGRNPRTAGNERGGSDRHSDGKWDGTTSRWDKGTTTGSSGDPAINDDLPADLQERAESTEERLFPQELGDQDQLEQQPTIYPPVIEEPRQEDEEELQFLLLLKFFTAMGYTEDVVKRVLARTGPKEASQILDLVQQEQDRNDREEQAAQANQDVITLGQREQNRPCETEHRDDREPTAAGESLELTNGEIREGAEGSTRDPQIEASSARRQEEEHEEDFVWGVLKKAAVSCGYTEQKVAEVYNMLPNRSTHHLLLELQKDEKKDLPDMLWEEPREIDDVVLEKEGQNFRPAESGTREDEPLVPSGERGPADQAWLAVPKKQSGQADVFDWSNKPDGQFTVNQCTSKKKHPSKLQAPHQNTLPEVKGPPMSTYTSSLDPTHAGSAQNQPNQPSIKKKPSQFPHSVKQALQAPHSPVLTGKDALTPRAKERASSVVVTGEQRFLEGLQTPFDLQLTDEPGDPCLRPIIIDGSNVAMSHGLGHFFSCRGIALAVQHFWDQGHRRIIAFLPQWRQKNDSRTKEQHYLTELQRLGLLSYTPSREVQGKRISCYDDRFMLQHAQKTDGVIVTNDNLRDLLNASPAWRDIIKKRLLQYTFVGDHFMVPDDPLGRGGPHLNDFLRLNHSNPRPGSHSFAGMANALQSSRPPRSQTEVLNFRDRTPANAEAGSVQSWDRPRQDRSLEETACLREQLCQVFAGQDNMVVLVLQCHPAERDINVLSDLILEQQKD